MPKYTMRPDSRMITLSKRSKVCGEGEWMVAQTVMLLTVRVSAFTSSITCVTHNVEFLPVFVGSRCEPKTWAGSEVALAANPAGRDISRGVQSSGPDVQTHADAERVEPKGMKR